MIEELFKNGKLELSTNPLVQQGIAPMWSDCLVNRILVLVAVVVFLLSFGEILRMFSKLVDCVFRGSYNQQLERNLGEKRSRDLLAFLSILPFCILVDRYSLYNCRFFNGVEAQWGVTVCVGVVFAWLLLHMLIWAIVQNSKSVAPRKDTVAAAHHCIYSFFIIMVSVMVMSVGGMKILSLQDEVISAVLRWEVIVGYAFSLWRFIRILLSHCSVISTFLYLCSLEFLPAAVVVAGEVV